MSDPRLSIIPAAAVLDPRLKARDLQVLCLFGRHTDKRGWCIRSQVKMAKEMGCARSTVQGSIDRLVAAGWIKRRMRKTPGQEGERDSAHEYRVVLDVPDDPQDVEGTPADISAPPADPEPAPPADSGSAPINDTTLTTPSLRSDSSARASFEDLWKIFPRRRLTNRKDAEAAFAELDDASADRCLTAAKRYAQWHVEDSDARNATPESQLEYRVGLGKWIRSGAWRDALSITLRSDPVPPGDNGLVVLSPDHPDFKAVERMRGRPIILGKSGKATFRAEEVEQARVYA